MCDQSVRIGAAYGVEDLVHRGGQQVQLVDQDHQRRLAPVDRGKTSLMILIDQLDLLAATMDKVFDAVCRADADALVAHGRFLAEKFGNASTGGALSLGPNVT